MTQLLIKRNNVTMREPCPICGEIHNDASIPWAIFVGDSGYAVCNQCAKVHDNEMRDMLADGIKRFWEKIWPSQESHMKDEVGNINNGGCAMREELTVEIAEHYVNVYRSLLDRAMTFIREVQQLANDGCRINGRIEDFIKDMNDNQQGQDFCWNNNYFTPAKTKEPEIPL